MLPKMELTEPVLLSFSDGRSDFACQCPEKEREKAHEEVEGEVIIKRLPYQLGHNDLSNFNETFTSNFRMPSLLPPYPLIDSFIFCKQEMLKLVHI